MPKPTYEFIPSPHFAKRTKQITAIVIHYTGSNTIESPINWFKNRDSKVSSHYVIGRDGRVVQMVHDYHIAWHAGRSAMFPKETPPREINVNAFSIGIELVATMDSGFTDKQLASLYELVAILISLYRILPERVVGHAHISPGRKIDPDGISAQFNWSKARNVAQVAYNALPKPGTALMNV